MQAEVGAVVPEAVSTTSWGTPALDVGAGVRAQLEALDVRVVDVAGLHPRVDRTSTPIAATATDAGRFAGLIRRHAGG